MLFTSFTKLAIQRNTWWPGYLFGQGQEGAILLPRPQYLYTDSAATTPVTSPGDPVGYMQDLSGNVNHATQSTDADRPIYGIVPATGRRNRLEYTEEFDNAAWVKSGVSIAENAVSSPDGTITGATLTATSDTNTFIRQAPSGISAARNLTVHVKAGTSNWLLLYTLGASSTGTWFDLSSGAVGSQQSAGVGSIEADENGWFKCTIDWSELTSNEPTNVAIEVVNADGSSVADIGQTLHIWHPVAASSASAYQKVRSQYEVTESGVRSLHYAALNYTNQKFSTTLPAGTYTVCIAGTNGSWFDTVTHSGGAFDFGPTTYTEGPDGILEVLGDILAIVPVEGTLTATEKARLKAYFKALGSPGVYELGAELVTNGDLSTGDTTGWLSNDSAVLSVNSGRLQVENGVSDAGDGYQEISTDSGDAYIISATLENGTVGSRLFVGPDLAKTDFAAFSDGYPLPTNVSGAFTASVSSVFVRVTPASASSGDNCFADNVSLRKMELVT